MTIYRSGGSVHPRWSHRGTAERTQVRESVILLETAQQGAPQKRGWLAETAWSSSCSRSGRFIHWPQKTETQRSDGNNFGQKPGEDEKEGDAKRKRTNVQKCWAEKPQNRVQTSRGANADDEVPKRSEAATTRYSQRSVAAIQVLGNDSSCSDCWTGGTLNKE